MEKHCAGVSFEPLEDRRSVSGLRGIAVCVTLALSLSCHLLTQNNRPELNVVNLQFKIRKGLENCVRILPSAPIRPSLSSSAAARKPLVSLSVRTRAPGENLWRKNLPHTHTHTEVQDRSWGYITQPQRQNAGTQGSNLSLCNIFTKDTFAQVTRCKISWKDVNQSCNSQRFSGLSCLCTAREHNLWWAMTVLLKAMSALRSWINSWWTGCLLHSIPSGTNTSAKTEQSRQILSSRKHSEERFCELSKRPTQLTWALPPR